MSSCAEMIEKKILVRDDRQESVFGVVEPASVLRLLPRCNLETGVENVGVKRSVVII